MNFVVAALVLAGCAGGARLPSDLTGYPDRPLEGAVARPLSPRFLVEHRSALNGRTVTLHGTVVRVITPEGDGAPPSGTAPRPGRFAQPRLLLADSDAKDLDPNHAVPVLLREGDPGYSVGRVVDVDGVVDGNRAAVVVRRLYTD